ncbi:bacteriohemerythrin [Deferribacteres bacterium DY0037]|uniref:bacteriohemerythrin n=1 Tax=Denitrovibrio acetiphilus TaxID=118000 RepID=UPI00145F0057|nr:bacteriohemerythrin [Denitrovibrio acetiphilus]
MSLIKNSRYFYTAIACMFALFVLLILVTGRQFYENEKNKLYTSKINELVINCSNFENRLNDVEIAIRRIINLMKQQELLESPDPTSIKSFISDFLFDHYYLSVIITSPATPLLKIDSAAYPAAYINFFNMESSEILKILEKDNYNINEITINKDLDIVYMAKNLTNAFGDASRQAIFFFSPELLLQYLPVNYALLLKGEGVQWIPDNGSFPLDFILPEDIGINSDIQISDTKTLFFMPISNNNNNYLLAAAVDISDLKKTLWGSTLATAAAFTLFFVLLFIMIYFRNSQVAHLINTQRATVVCLANLAEFKDNETADHLERTRHYGTLLSNYLRKIPKFRKTINKDYLDNIGFASVLHDIGKVGVPDNILKKPDKLDEEEFEVIKQHPQFAKNILKGLVEKHKINDLFFHLAFNIAAYHHEKWDGSGYPDGLKGNQIPLEARIFSICDVYDALRSERVYKKPFPHDISMEIINEGRGTHFDPEIVDTFNECADQFRQIHNTYDMFYTQISYATFGNNKRELRVEWTPALSVGIEEIDSQHKILLSKINMLIKAILEGKGDENILNLLRFLESYSEEHFQTEERIMRQIGFEFAEQHTAAHDIFRQNLRRILKLVNKSGISQDIFADIEKNLISWLLEHIVKMDTKISGK